MFLHIFPGSGVGADKVWIKDGPDIELAGYMASRISGKSKAGHQIYVVYLLKKNIGSLLKMLARYPAGYRAPGKFQNRLRLIKNNISIIGICYFVQI